MSTDSFLELKSYWGGLETRLHACQIQGFLFDCLQIILYHRIDSENKTLVI